MEILNNLLECIELGKPVAHVAILHQDGSTPRTAGARMLVFEDGSIVGTIGGGQVEAFAIKTALESLKTGRAVRASFDLTQNSKDMDMICGGRLETLIEPLVDAAKCLPVLQAALECRNARRPFTLVTSMHQAKDDPGACRTDRMLFAPAHHDKPEISFSGGVDEDSLSEVLQEAGTEPWVLISKKDADFLVEQHLPRESVYLFGGGHVAQKIAHIAHFTGFRVGVIDDRPEFANAERFPEAELILTPPDFEKLFELPELAASSMGESDYLLIMTRGHAFDGDILEQALRTKAGYIGMIGSRAKRETTYRKLEAESFGESDFKRVHCPIGIDIGAQTPEEIAISVTAELVMHRAGGPKRG